MYCPKCGTLNSDQERLCRVCSWLLRSDGYSTVTESPDAKVSPLATVSMILAVLSVFTFGLTILPAMICGIIAAIKIDRSGGMLRGKGRAIFGFAGPFLLIPVLALTMMSAAIASPALGNVRDLAQRLNCGENINELGESIIAYADDNGGILPQADNWCDVLVYEQDVDPDTFICPNASSGRSSYAMNVNAAGKNLYSLPADTVLLFESYPAWNTYGAAEIVNMENHRGEGFYVVFCDGHIEFIEAIDIQRLTWDDYAVKEAGDAQN
jgi:hypothetical protein